MKKLYIIIIALAVLAGAATAFVTFFCEDDWCHVFPWQKASVVVPDDWRVYSSNEAGFTVKYDPTLEIVANTDTSVQFYKWGPTQTGETEVYDGIIIGLRRVIIQGGIDAYAAKTVEDLKKVGTITVPLHDVKINGMPAKQISVSAPGDFTITLIPVDKDNVIEIAYTAPDPTNAGFQKIADTMLATVELIR